MKRCPECRRDYYDDSLLYCLDDGSALLEGPASDRAEPPASGSGDLGEEPATAILSHSPASENRTRPFIRTTESEAEPRSSSNELPEKRFVSANRTVKPLAMLAVAVVILVGGFFGYRYFTTSEHISSIAVMPFVNDSANPDVEYLSDGMTETLIKGLSTIPSLSVKSRSAVFFYKDKQTTPQRIGDELGVQAVLLGHVNIIGENLKVSLELVNTQTQDVIWTDQYAMPRSEVVSLQSKIARDVSTTLRERLSGVDQAKVTKASTEDPEAYQAYLRGRYHFNRRTVADLAKAIEEFKRATDRDPNYALAFSGLADAFAIYSDYAGSAGAEYASKVRSNAERAIALDDQLGEPHATLAILSVQDRQWDDALREGKLAVELSPNYPTGVQWYASILLDLGRYDEAAEMMKRAHELDPVSAPISNGLSNAYEVQNNFEAAISNSLRYIEMNPTFPTSYRDLGLYYSKLGRHSEAVANGEKAVALERASYLLGDLGYIYGAAGRRDEALAIASELEARYSKKQSAGRYIAEVYSGLGQYEGAMKWLEKDLQSNNGRLSEVRWTIPFQSMHAYGPFKDLIERMGMPPL